MVRRRQQVIITIILVIISSSTRTIINLLEDMLSMIDSMVDAAATSSTAATTTSVVLLMASMLITTTVATTTAVGLTWMKLKGSGGNHIPVCSMKMVLAMLMDQSRVMIYLMELLFNLAVNFMNGCKEVFFLGCLVGFGSFFVIYHF